MSKITLKNLRSLIREEIARAYQSSFDLGSSDDEIDIGTDVAVADANSANVGKVTNRYSGQSGKDTVWTIKTDDGKTLQKRAEDIKTIGPKKPGSVEKHEPDDDENLLIDKDLHEIDEKREEDDFKERHYLFLAKQIVFKWTDHSPEVSWKAVADSYVRAAKSTNGKTLDSKKLYAAIQDALTDMENCKSDGTYTKATDAPHK